MTPLRSVYRKKRNGSVIVPADEAATIAEQLRWLAEILNATCNHEGQEQANFSAYAFEAAKRREP